MSSLINRAAVRAAFLERIQIVRPGTVFVPTRVAESALVDVEAATLKAIDRIIATHPTKGKTITGSGRREEITT